MALCNIIYVLMKEVGDTTIFFVQLYLLCIKYKLRTTYDIYARSLKLLSIYKNSQQLEKRRKSAYIG